MTDKLTMPDKLSVPDIDMIIQKLPGQRMIRNNLIPRRQLLIVMPALNEEEAIANVISETISTLPSATILVVDDGSTDNTAEVARQAGAKVLSLPFNLGVGGAMRVGFRYAVENNYPIVIQVDSDGQHDPALIPQLIERLDSADLVIGARFAGTGNYQVHGPRRWAMYLLAKTLSSVAKVRLTDTTSGFRAAGPNAVKLFSSHYPAEYLGDTIESLVIAIRAGLKVEQVPIEMRARAGGVPSQSVQKATAYLARAGLALVIALIRPPVKLHETTR